MLDMRLLNGPAVISEDSGEEMHSEQCGSAGTRVLVLSSSCDYNPFERRIFPVPEV